MINGTCGFHIWCVFACCGALCVPANWSMTRVFFFLPLLIVILECLHTICYNTFLFHSVWLELYSVLSWWFSCWPAVVVNVDVTIKKSWAPTEKSSSLSFRIWYAVILCVLHVWLWYRHFFFFFFLLSHINWHGINACLFESVAAVNMWDISCDRLQWSSVRHCLHCPSKAQSCF